MFRGVLVTVFLINSFVCRSLRTNFLNGFMKPSTKRSYAVTGTDLRCVSNLAPPTGTAVNYLKNSRRAELLFADFEVDQSHSYVNVTLISKSGFQNWSTAICNQTHDFLESLGQSMKKFPGGKSVSLPVSENLSIVSTLAFYDDTETTSKLSHKAFDGLWSSLKNKTYNFRGINETELTENIATKLSMSWALSSYKFEYFKSSSIPSGKALAKVVWPLKCDRQNVLSVSRAYTLMKDLVDSPALSLGPSELQATAEAVGVETNASYVRTVVGVKNLIEENYPQIAAVGMAAAEGREPRIVDIRWEAPSREKSSSEASSGSKNSSDNIPEIVIIGKGITFDTGGLNIKGGGGMRNMKRDMAGAAQAVALALWIVESKFPVKLRLLLPIAENSISGIALRPGDVIKARNGKTTEITNTDAEGRLVLADALVAAIESPNSPTLIVDFATLTGAARVALGNDMPAIFSNKMDSLQRLWNISNTHNDPTWMMPLYEPMRGMIKSQIADLVNAADGLGGAITAALYLSEFITPVPSKDKAASKELRENDSDTSVKSTADVTPQLQVQVKSEGSDDEAVVPAPSPVTWFHIDFMGAKGGQAEPQGMRAVYEYIKSEHVEKP